MKGAQQEEGNPPELILSGTICHFNMLDDVSALRETAWESVSIPAGIPGSCLASSLKEKEAQGHKEDQEGIESPQ